MCVVNRFPWLESLLVVAMAVALIVKPPSRVVSASVPSTAPANARIEAPHPVHQDDQEVVRTNAQDHSQTP